MRSLALLSLLAAATAHAGEFGYLPPSDAGRLRCGVPAGWQRPEFDDGPWLAPPLPDGGARDAGEPCDALRVRRSFDVGPEGATLATVTLRARYRDGLAAWLNGVEIARRRLVDGAPLAVEPHGPEPERFVVRVTPGLLRPTGNVLAVEARPATGARTPHLETALDGADGARLLRGPYLQGVLDGTAQILLETDLAARVAVSWSRLGGDGKEREVSGPPGTRHTLRLDGLAPATAYRYRVRSLADGLPPVEVEGAFHTPPRGDRAPLRFVVVGDVRSGHDVHARIARAIAAEDPDLVLVTGDLVDRGSEEGEWERFFDIAAPLLRQVAIYPAPGNHEYVRGGRGVEKFLAGFPRPATTTWWSFDVAGVHFACIDSEQFKNPEQLAWLDRDLAEARRRPPRAVFVYDHDGPWSSGMHGDNAIAVRDVAPILERHRVTMVMSGHDHHYERGRVGNVEYLVSGGGGAELRNPRCTVEPVPGKRRCGPRVRAFINEHHYVVFEVLRDRVRLCPKRPDGTPLEPCQDLSLRR